MTSLISIISGFFEYKSYKNNKHPLISNSVFKIPFACLFLGLCFGGMRFQSSIPIPSSTNILGYINAEPISLTGVVKTDPIKSNDFTTAVVRSEFVTIGGKKFSVKGDVSIILPAGFDIRYGDRLSVFGKLSKTYKNDLQLTRSYLAQNKIFTQMAFPETEVLSYENGNRIIDVLYQFRERAHRIIFNNIPFPESALLSGILLGIETEIPEYLWDSYQATGTIHIIAISGFNITVITLLVFRIFRKLVGWKWTLPATISTIILYTLLVGADPPVVRAAIMGVVALMGHQIGRRTVSIYTLVLAAVTMLLVNPFLLWSVSFQLTFLATLALFTIVEPLDKWIKYLCENFLSENIIRFVIPVFSLFTTTLSVTVIIFPILYKLNPAISTVSLLANFFIAPIQPAIMLLGAIAVFSGFYIGPSLNVFAMVVWPIIYFCNQIAIRLSISNSVIIPLPKFAFWISLAISILLVVYFSYQNILALSRPKIDKIRKICSSNREKGRD